MTRIWIGWIKETEQLQVFLRGLHQFKYIQVMYDNNPIEIESSQFGYKWSDLFAKALERKNEMGLTKDDFYILVVDKPDEWNWFSAWPLNYLYVEPPPYDFDKDMNIGFVHADGWEYFQIQKEYAVFYQIFRLFLEIQMIQSVIRHQMNPNDDFLTTVLRLYREEWFLHKQARGCVNDMCADKIDILNKLRTADVCSECKDIIDKHNFCNRFMKDVSAVFEKVRNALINVREYLDDEILVEVPVHYPAVIASMKQQWDNVRRFAEPHTKIRDAVGYFDYMIKYTCILLYRENDKEWSCNPRPALGNWVNRFQRMTTKAFGLNQEDRHRIAEVYNILNRLKIQDNDYEQTIVQYRNDNVGHGHLIGYDYNFNREAEALDSAIQEVEVLLWPIWEQRKLFHPTGGSSYVRNGALVQGYKLSGNKTSFPIEERLISHENAADTYPLLEKLHEGDEQYRIIMFNDNQKAFDMHDHIRYQKCDICNKRRLTMKDGDYWLDVESGHRIRS